ncbi:hypothetical protein HDU79_001472 [Rhizoclosmatium sp. JEL0117]|nr:hypothetical protein HDU79_001472 [Rhizoclosmatium sp. JEL0117]
MNLDSLGTTFESIGASPRIAANLKSVFNIDTPSQMQTALFPAVLSHRDVVLKDETGSGKSFGLLCAILSKKSPLVVLPSDTVQNEKSDSEVSIKGKPKKLRYLANILVAPTPELALQFYQWSLSLLQGIHASDIPKHVQLLLPQTSFETQAQLLQTNTPTLLIGTPRRLLDVIVTEPIVDISRLQTIVLDEADTLVRVPSRFETNKDKLNRLNHPLYSEQLMDYILEKRRPESIGGTIGSKKRNTLENPDTKGNTRAAITPLPASLTRATESAPTLLKTRASLNPTTLIDPAAARRLQVILCSATMNNPVRKELERMRGWIVNPITMDVNGTHSAPTSITHHCIVLGPNGTSLRNMHSKEEQDAIHASTPSADREPVYLAKLRHPALSDDDPRVLNVVKQYIQRDGVTRGILFLASSFSCARVVAYLKSVGIKAARTTEDVDFNAATSAYMDTNYSFAQVGERKEATGVVKAAGFFQSGNELMVISEHNARGLDLPDVTHVFMVGPPSSPGSYLHMCGRVGRFGKPGKSVLVLGGERYERKMADVYKLLKIDVGKCEDVEGLLKR